MLRVIRYYFNLIIKTAQWNKSSECVKCSLRISLLSYALPFCAIETTIYIYTHRCFIGFPNLFEILAKYIWTIVYFLKVFTIQARHSLIYRYKIGIINYSSITSLCRVTLFIFIFKSLELWKWHPKIFVGNLNSIVDAIHCATQGKITTNSIQSNFYSAKIEFGPILK